MKKYKPENTIANVNGQHVRIVNNSVKQIAKYVVGLSDDKLEEDINVSTVKNNCYICKDIIVEIRAEQVLKPGDIISYPLNENTNLNVRVPDIIISGNSNNVLYNKRNEAAMKIQRFWRNRFIRKYVKIIELAQENQVKQFTSICWGLTIMLGIGKEALKVASKGRQDISPMVVPFSCFLFLLISMRTLVLGDQMKYYIYITIGVWYVSVGIFSLISDLILDGLEPVWAFTYLIFVPVLFFFHGYKIIIFATILQYEYKENIKQVSSIIIGRMFAALPVVILFALQAQQLRFALPVLEDSMCKLMPGANPPSTLNPSWSNCTTNNKVNVYYPAEPNSINEIELKMAIEDYVPVGNQVVFQYFQAAEPIILLFTGQTLFRVCRLTIRDILAIRISFLEIAVLIASALNSLNMFLLGSIGMKPSFSTPAAYESVTSSLRYFVFIPIFLIRFIALLLLIKNGQKCMNMEINGEDPLKYSHGVRVIHKRGIHFRTYRKKKHMEEKAE